MNIPSDAQRLMTDVEQIFDRAKTQYDPLIQSDFAKYLVVRVSGLVEQVIYEIVQAHTSPQASATVASYVERRMRTFQNPNLERILQLASSFNGDWRNELESDIGRAEREALGSINAQRNKVAHGQDSTISLAQVLQYYDEIVSLLKKVAQKF